MPGDSASKISIPEIPYGTVVGGDFMVVHRLNKGATGSLYVAEQLSTASNRALKVLRRDFLADATLYKRFEREAQIAAKIPSDHVTQVIAAGVDRKLDVPWIAMELLEGLHLGDYIELQGPLEKEGVSEITEQICHAIAAAHGLGIVHRDLKPANIFLSKTRRIGQKNIVKVLDFGVAKIVSESLTLQGVALGTPSWMSPEQMMGETALPASDVWSLGLLAFYMLTGKIFWLAGDPTQEICYDPIPIASMRALALGVHERIPRGFDEWFALAVSRVPTERFMSAAAAYAALARVLA